jgi:hypothetical protein
MARKATTNSAIILLLGAVATIAVASVAVSSCQEEVGLAEPSTGTVALVAELNEAQAVLDSGESYDEYQAAFRVASSSYETMALHSAADTKMRAMLASPVGCMSVVREAWQAEVEGEWAEETYGSAEYWRAAHPEADLDLPSGVLSPEDVRSAASECAEQGLAEASAVVSE